MLVYGVTLEWGVMAVADGVRTIVAVLPSKFAADVFADEMSIAFPDKFEPIKLDEFERLYCTPIEGVANAKKRDKQTSKN